MNETLKGVAHIGAEMAAAKADLQREMERHRKTWRQLEQVTGLLREIEDEVLLDNSTAARIQIALSLQAEPVEPIPIGESTARLMHAYAVGEFDNEGGSETVEAMAVQSYDAKLAEGVTEYEDNSYMAGYGAALYEQAHPLLALVRKAEPAPAQDERTAFEAWVMQHNTAVREDYDDTDENAPEDIRLDRQGGVYIWANAEAAWFAWKARSALDTRPAQTAPLFGDEGHVSVPRGLIGAACSAIDKKRDSPKVLAELRRYTFGDLSKQTAAQREQSGTFAMHQQVRKISGSEWEGHICGTYSTELTPDGYAVESAAHKGSVQIYPAKALELVPSNE